MNTTAYYVNYFDDKMGRDFNIQKTLSLGVKLYSGSIYTEGSTVNTSDVDYTIADNTTTYLYYRFSDNSVQQTTDLPTAQGGYILFTIVASSGSITSISRMTAWIIPIKSLNTTDFVKDGTTGEWKLQTVSIAKGGTGATTRQTAINALTGTQTSGTYLRSDGTNATLTAIQQEMYQH